MNNYRTDIQYNNGKIQVKNSGADARIPLPEAQLTDNLQLGYKASILNDLHLTGIENDSLIDDALTQHEAAVGFVKRFVEARENQHPQHTQYQHLSELKQEHDRFTQNQAHFFASKREKLQLKAAEIDKQFEQEFGFDTKDAAEIRSNLRFMTEEQRNEVINSAIENKDGNILASVLGAHALNSGITKKKQTMIRTLAMKKHAPNLLALQKASKRVDQLLFNTFNDILSTSDNLTSKSVMDQAQAKRANELKL